MKLTATTGSADTDTFACNAGVTMCTGWWTVRLRGVQKRQGSRLTKGSRTALVHFVRQDQVTDHQVDL